MADKLSRAKRARAWVLGRVPLPGWALSLFIGVFLIATPVGLWLEHRGDLASKPLTTNLLSGAIGASFGLPFLAFVIQRSQRKVALARWAKVHGSVTAGVLEGAIHVGVNGLYVERAEFARFAPTARWDDAPATMLDEPDGAMRWLTQLAGTPLVDAPAKVIEPEHADLLRTTAYESYELLDDPLSTLVSSPLVSDVAPIIHEARRLLRQGANISGPSGTLYLSYRQAQALFGAVERLTTACTALRDAHK